MVVRAFSLRRRGTAIAVDEVYAHSNNYRLNCFFTQLLPSLPTANPPPSAGRHGRGRRLDVPCISKQWTALSPTASGELPLVALTPSGFDTSTSRVNGAPTSRTNGAPTSVYFIAAICGRSKPLPYQFPHIFSIVNSKITFFTRFLKIFTVFFLFPAQKANDAGNNDKTAEQLL